MAVVVDVRVVDASGRDLRSVSPEVKGAMRGGPVVVREAAHLHGLVAGCRGGQVMVEGDAGDYLGVLNDGASIHVAGNAGRFLGDNMTRGAIVVEGDAGDGAGQYCYGGTIVVKGSAGSLTAVMNKGATIVIGGDVGDDAATYMLAGDLVIAGDAGSNLGNYLIRGHIYVGGRWQSLGHNTRQEEMTGADVARLRGYFAQAGIQADPTAFKKIGRLSEKPFYK